MAQEIKIQLKIDGLDSSQKSVKLLSSSIETLTDTSKQAQKSFSGITDNLSGLKGVVGIVTDALFSLKGVLATIGLGLGFGKVIEEAEKLNDAFDVMETVARGTGTNLQDLKAAAESLSSDGLIPINETSAVLRNLLNSGLGLPKAIELFKSMREIAAYNKDENVSLSQALLQVSEGVRKGNNFALNAINLGGKAIEIESQYAASLGKTSGQLTIKEKTQGLANFLIEQGAKYQGDYNRLQEEFSSVTKGAKTAVSLLLAEVGMLIIKNPIVINGIRSFTEWIKELSVSFKQLVVDIKLFTVDTLTLFLKWGSEVETVLKYVEALLIGVAALAFTNLSVAIALFAANSVKALLSFVVSLNAAKIAIFAFEAAISAGLLIVLTELIVKLVEVKDTVGSWSNFFTRVGNNLQIIFIGLNIWIEEALVGLKELAYKGFEPIISQINKLLRLVGKEEIKFDFAEKLADDIDNANENITDLISKMDDLNSENEKMITDTAKNGKRMFGEEFAKNSIKALNSSLYEVQKEFDKPQNELKIAVGLSTEAMNKLHSDFNRVKEQLKGLEGGDLGKLKSDYEERKKIILDAYKYQIKLADGTVVNEELKNTLMLASDNEYFKKLAELQRKEGEIRRKIVNDAIASIKDPIKSAFTDITEGMDELSKQKFAPQIKIAIETNIAGIALGFIEALKSGSVGFLTTISNFASNLLDPEKAKVLFGKLEEVLPEVVKGLTQFTDKIPGIVGQIIGLIPAILQIFGQAPELFRKMISDSITNIPELIGNIIVNIAELFSGKFIDKVIVGFINNIPMLVESLVYAIVTLFSSPVFWVRIVLAAVNAFIRAIPRIIQGFVDGFTKGFADLFKGFLDLGNLLGQIGSALWAVLSGIWSTFGSIVNLLWGAFSSFGGVILDAAWDFFDTIILGAARFIETLLSKIPVIGSMFSSGGSGIPIVGGIIDSIGGAFGFAEGGMFKKVPAGFPSDTFPARLTSNELVVDPSTTKKLQDFLSNQSQPQSTDRQISNSLLVKIMDLLERPMTVESTVQVNQKAFADIILSLNRTNQRLA